MKNASIMCVDFFPSCVVDALLPQVGTSAIRVLQRQGVSVHCPPRQVCCGQSLTKAGHIDSGRRAAAAWVRAFRGSRLIVSPSGSCVAHVRHTLPGLVADHPRLAAEAHRLARNTYELSEYLWRVLQDYRPVAPGFPGGSFTYHPSCGLHRVLGENEAPYALLDALPGAERLTLPDAERCCGFGGPFAVTHHELSGVLMTDKLRAARSTGTDTLVVGDVGCFLHLKTGAAKSDPGLRVRHLAQALAGDFS